MLILLRAGVCGKLPQRTSMYVAKVIRALIDWENDEAYLVQLAHAQTQEPIDYYTVVWPENEFRTPSNGSSNDGSGDVLYYHISTHLAPVKAGEKVWIGGMCRDTDDAALILFLSPQGGFQDELRAHVQADRCRPLGNLQRVLIAAVLTDGIDTQGDSYWLVQLANTKGEPRPWYSLAWECTLEANLHLPGGDCR